MRPNGTIFIVVISVVYVILAFAVYGVYHLAT